MMDVIFIRELKVDAIIGLYPEERKNKQPIMVDLELSVDMRPIAQTDAITSTIDYDVLVQKVLAFIEASQYQLLETLADKTAEFVLSRFKLIRHVRLVLRKPQALSQTPCVGVIVERAR